MKLIYAIMFFKIEVRMKKKKEWLNFEFSVGVDHNSWKRSSALTEFNYEMNQILMFFVI